LGILFCSNFSGDSPLRQSKVDGGDLRRIKEGEGIRRGYRGISQRLVKNDVSGRITSGNTKISHHPGTGKEGNKVRWTKMNKTVKMSQEAIVNQQNR